jgi:hypothetical protein
MILYSVTVHIEPQIESEWVEWMRSVHIPDVLRTGCFTECRMHRLLDVPAGELAYVMHYDCRSIDDYHRYRDEFAPALQKDHSDHFAGKFRGARQLLEQTALLEPPQAG